MQKNTSIILKACLITSAFIVYSGTSFFSKSASMQHFLSLPYIIYFGGVFVCMGVYAILWQKVLSFMPLNKAFLFKSVTLLIVLMISNIIFKEAITKNNMIGASFIVVGLIILSWKE